MKIELSTEEVTELIAALDNSVNLENDYGDAKSHPSRVLLNSLLVKLGEEPAWSEEDIENLKGQ